MTLRPKKKALSPVYFVPVLLTFSASGYTSSLYVGHSSSEQISILGERTIDLTPSGESLYASLDLNENWSLNGSLTRLEDDASIDSLARLTFEIDTYSLGASYFSDDWSLFYSYSSFDDEQIVFRNNSNERLSSESTDVKTHSIGAGYFWTFQEQWQISLSGSVHFSDWEQSLVSDLPDPDRPPQSSLDSGDSTLLSVSANFARFIELNESTSLTPGVYISWNEALDSSSEAVSRNGRNVSQLRNPDVRSQVNSQVATGTESYGQLSLYLSLDFFDDWVLDLDTSFDFGTDENTQSWSINLGYFF